MILQLSELWKLTIRRTGARVKRLTLATFANTSLLVLSHCIVTWWQWRIFAQSKAQCAEKQSQSFMLIDIASRRYRCFQRPPTPAAIFILLRDICALASIKFPCVIHRQIWHEYELWLNFNLICLFCLFWWIRNVSLV